MEQLIDEETMIATYDPDYNPGYKLYSIRQICAGTFLGGPLCAVAFIARNYANMGKRSLQKWTWFVGIPITILIFVAIYTIPEVIFFPNYFIPLLNMALAGTTTLLLQGKAVHYHLDQGEECYSWGRAIGLSLLYMAISFAGIFIVAFTVAAINIL